MLGVHFLGDRPANHQTSHESDPVQIYVELSEMAPHVGAASTFISYAQAGKWGDLRQWPSVQPDLVSAGGAGYVVLRGAGEARYSIH